MQLSANFSLDELTFSAQAVRIGRKVEAPPEVIANLKRGCETVYQPIRDSLTDHYGKDIPIVPTSGYRPQWLNTLIGGSKNSDHMWGGALDSRALFIPVFEYAEFIRDRITLWPIDKLIFEYGSWVHISIARLAHDPARTVLTAIRSPSGETQYISGLVK